MNATDKVKSLNKRGLTDGWKLNCCHIEAINTFYSQGGYFFG
jgi:hypothetical protein